MNPFLIAGAMAKGRAFVWGLLKWIAILGFIGICGWGLYAGLIRPTTKPNPTETQEADSIVNKNFYLQPHFGGCASLRVEAEKK